MDGESTDNERRSAPGAPGVCIEVCEHAFKQPLAPSSVQHDPLSAMDFRSEVCMVTHASAALL